MNFEYISANIPGPGRDPVDFRTELPGCDCGKDAKCNDSSVCICLRYGPNYDPDGYLLPLVADGSNSQNDAPVFECGSACQCGPSCGNRVLQFGIQAALEVFDADCKGYGLRTRGPLHRGQFVCEYAGEVIDLTEASERFRSLPAGAPNYIFVLREHSISSGTPTVITTCIDPTKSGNLGRFINHSCEPNLSIAPVRYDNVVPHLGLFANRDIEAGEELCYSYGGGQGNEPQGLSTKPCHCGAKNCLSFLPLDKDLFMCAL